MGSDAEEIELGAHLNYKRSVFRIVLHVITSQSNQFKSPTAHKNQFYCLYVLFHRLLYSVALISYTKDLFAMYMVLRFIMIRRTESFYLELHILLLSQRTKNCKISVLVVLKFFCIRYSIKISYNHIVFLEMFDEI